MEERSKEYIKDQVSDIYLNAGLLAGKAKDLLRVIQALDIHEEEDDQAVLTAYMYRNPNSIVLDYRQSMFGNNRWTLGVEDGCMFSNISSKDRRLVHKETGTSPLFIHSPGGFMKCHWSLLDKLHDHSARRGLRKERAKDNNKRPPSSSSPPSSSISPSFSSPPSSSSEDKDYSSSADGVKRSQGNYNILSVRSRPLPGG